LFRRAIVQSGGVQVHSVDEAERAAERLVQLLGVAACDRASLRDVPATELVAATEELGRRRPDPGMVPLPFLPVVDGVFLPDDPLAAVANGSSRGVDLMIGTNRDELTLFGLGNPALMALDEEGVHRWVTNALPGVPTADVIDAYRTARRARGEGVQPTDIWVAVGSDVVFRWPSMQLASAHAARGAPAYLYLFDWESPAFGGMLGSSHALELPFVFGAVHVPVVQIFSGSGREVEVLSRQMQDAWLAFAHRGDPSHSGIGAWPNWDSQVRTTMIFGARTRAESAPRNAELELLERYRPLVSGVPG
jgi:para-nitrobenzyl esterase